VAGEGISVPGIVREVVDQIRIGKADTNQNEGPQQATNNGNCDSLRKRNRLIGCLLSFGNYFCLARHGSPSVVITSPGGGLN